MTSNQSQVGIYIHIPFCRKKCDYCDFYSLPVNNNNEVIEVYTNCLITELKQRREEAAGQFTSIYLGGGTPSLLKPQQIERILDTIYGNYLAGPQPEITVEANPATLNLQTMKDYRAAGVNRLSIGIQSFADRELRLLGRMHGRDEAESALRNASKAGFVNYSADLIYGIPGQQEKDWLNNLHLLEEYELPHLSIYLLQLEDSTPLAGKIQTGAVVPAEEELEIKLYRMGLDYLQERGYSHYELSNLARPGLECRHNLVYWHGERYLGFGCGAVSFDGGSRWLNQPPLENYIDTIRSGRKPIVTVLETMDSRQLAVDTIILGLRLTTGINLSEYNQRLGLDIMKEFQEAIELSREEKLLVIKDGRLYLDPRAYFLSNRVFRRFLG